LKVVSTHSEEHLGDRTDAKFPIDGLAVVVGGAGGDAQLLADLAIGKSLKEAGSDLQLSAG